MKRKIKLQCIERGFWRVLEGTVRHIFIGRRAAQEARAMHRYLKLNHKPKHRSSK